MYRLDCSVFGEGDACWACGSTNLLRGGPLVDQVVFGLELDHNVQHVSHVRTEA